MVLWPDNNKIIDYQCFKFLARCLNYVNQIHQYVTAQNKNIIGRR